MFTNPSGKSPQASGTRWFTEPKLAAGERRLVARGGPRRRPSGSEGLGEGGIRNRARVLKTKNLTDFRFLRIRQIRSNAGV